MKNPPPPSGSLESASVIPDTHAHWFSKLTFEWIHPMLSLGYARPLETTDLWALDDWRSSELYASRIISSFERRRVAADAHNARVKSGELGPPLRKRMWWSLKGKKVRIPFNGVECKAKL